MTFKNPSRLVDDSDAFDVLGDRSGRPRRRVWRYMWAPLAGLAILVVLLVTTRVVLAVAGRKDDLRRAQIAIAAAGQTEFAMMHTPVGLIGGQVAGPDEYTLSAHLRFTLLDEMTQLQHYWPTPLARHTHADAQALAGQIVALMDLIRQHRLRSARALYQRPITPMSDTYLAELTRAQKALSADTNGADHRAAAAASGIAVVAGVLLLLLFLVSAAARGRLQRADVEEGVLAALATTDSLTGVPNHRALILSLRAEFERARRYQRPLALLFMDIDHFKQVNDQHGHAAGDMALAAFANIVADTLRSADAFGRWGGEEFVAVLPETTAEDALATAERIRVNVSEHRYATFGSHRLTCSIGIAIYPDHAAAPNTLVAAADEAMYAAKRLGRNRCETAAAPVTA